LGDVLLVLKEGRLQAITSDVEAVLREVGMTAVVSSEAESRASLLFPV